jgi:hypothetical protein
MNPRLFHFRPLFSSAIVYLLSVAGKSPSQVQLGATLPPSSD